MKAIWLAVVMTFAVGSVVWGQTATKTEPQIPLIQFDNCPLLAAIENLAREAEFNITIDPQIAAAGSPTSASLLTGRWENLTAKEALDRILKARGLFLVANPQTGVNKVTATNSPPRVFAKDFVESSKDVIPLIRMDYAPLEVAMADLGAKAGMTFQLNPKLSDPSKPSTGRISVSVRFSNLTASQAVAAICDQHNLEITKSDKTGVWAVSPGK